MDKLHNTLSSSAYCKSLAIVVPYRDRAGHLARFIPHILAYFAHDKLDRQIPISIHIIEQTEGAPFNGGKLKNCGYILAREHADYICFHDVDYLPIWADYSWSPRPARLVWHGLRISEDWETFFGAAVLFDKAAFERVNGYPNVYWGWGSEDVELGARCELTGLGFERRDGTYRALPHRHAGFAAPGIYTEAAWRNRALFRTRRERIRESMDDDGLRDLRFNMIRRLPVTLNEIELPNAFHYLIDIGQPECPPIPQRSIEEHRSR